jgi:hypothetical protein
MTWALCSDPVAEPYEAPRGGEQNCGEREIGDIHHDERLRDVSDQVVVTTMTTALNPSKSRPRDLQAATRSNDHAARKATVKVLARRSPSEIALDDSARAASGVRYGCQRDMASNDSNRDRTVGPLALRRRKDGALLDKEGVKAALGALLADRAFCTEPPHSTTDARRRI